MHICHFSYIYSIYFFTASSRSTDCHEEYSASKVKGIFKSPGFPNKYPENTKCSYFFQANKGGRIKINFDLFDLEGPSDNGCQFDYIEINDVNESGSKSLMQKFCGSDTPAEFVSLQQKMEIVFVSDSTKNLNGFIGHYEFLSDNWHPFGPSTIGCGPGYLTGHSGVITSPQYPNSFPKNSHCYWIIKVKETEKILIHVLDLDLSSSIRCTDTFLQFFNGFAIPGMLRDEQYCGNLNTLDQTTEFISTNSRVVIRFETGLNDYGRHHGFKLVWTAVKLVSTTEPCDGFLCTGSQECPDINPDCKIPLLHFCIDKQLRCNGLPNCGPFDDTDEEECLSRFIWIIIYASIPAVCLIFIVIITIYCFRRHKRKKLHVAKTEIQRKQQTHWISPHIRSLENSPNTARSTTATAAVHTTSFITNKNEDSDTEENKKIKVKNKEDIINKDSVQNLLGNDIQQSKQSPGGAENHKGGTIRVHFDLPESQNYKSHQKRSSYHLMQELNLEEASNVIIADI